MVITPPILNPNDKIGLVSTAKKLTVKDIQSAIEMIQNWGLKVEIGKTLSNSYNQFAGTDDERAADFQHMLDNPEIKAILCARGGYGTVRIIDKLDFSSFVKRPKWIAGFSDVTVLHSHIHSNFNIATLHSFMPIFINSATEASKTSLKNALFGEKPEYTFESNQLNRPGSANAPVIGGNLSVLFSLNGSRSDIVPAGKILFLEDLTEYLYHIDRMMMNMKRSGKLENLAGLMVGGFTEMCDNEIPFGKNAEEIILDAVSEYDYPVCFGFPAGHFEDNRTIKLGVDSTLEITNKSTLFRQE